MMNAIFLDSFFEKSIRNPNYFNGRVLTESDLQSEQTAQRTRARLLGEAVGEGVAYGLAVAGASDQLTITRGLAVNRCGDGLHLAVDVTVKLVATTPALAAVDSPFAPCAIPVALQTTGIVSSEVSLLAVAPATRYSAERAATSSIDGRSARTCSQSRYEEEGVQFKLIPLDATSLDVTLTSVPTRRQSDWAHAGLGTAMLIGQSSRPLTAPAVYGLADTLRAREALLETDVPLALLRFAGNKVQWIDLWSVRRPCGSDLRPDIYPMIEAGTVRERFTVYAGRRRTVEARACLLQFQSQVDTLRRTHDNPLTVRAVEHFTYLPPVGFLQVTAPGVSGGRRFVPATFFGEELPRRTIKAAYVRDLVTAALALEPISLDVDALPLELLEVEDASADNPYLLFVRRERALAEVPDPGKPDPKPDPDPAPSNRGNLVIAVTDVTGAVLSADYVGEITVVHCGGGKVDRVAKRLEHEESATSGFTGKFAEVAASASAAPHLTYELVEASYHAQSKYGQGRADPSQILAPSDPAIYVIRDLPYGCYVVNVAPAAGSRYQAGKAKATVESVYHNQCAVVLKRMPSHKPKGEVLMIVPPIEWQNGFVVEEVVVDLTWEDLIDDGDIDPPPDWVLISTPRIVGHLEEVIRPLAMENPHVAQMDPVLWVDPTYSPLATSQDLYAVIQTADGSFHPTVLVAGDNRLDTTVPATRSGLRDIDDTVYNTQLAPQGLGRMDVLASAPGVLVGAAMGLAPGDATGVIDDVRATLQADYLGALSQFPGMDKQTSDALLAHYATELNLENVTLVDLANLSADKLHGALNGLGLGDFSVSYVDRLLGRMRNSVPGSSWSLEAMNLGTERLAALHAAGIETKRDLIVATTTQADAEHVAAILGIDAAGLEEMRLAAVAEYAGGQLATAPAVGVGSVPGVTPLLAKRLAAMQIGTAAKLAVADRTRLAQELELTTEQATGLVAAAAGKTGSYATIVANLGGDAAMTTVMKNAGFVTITDLAGADHETLTNALDGDAVLAGRLINTSSMLLGGGMRRIGP